MSRIDEDTVVHLLKDSVGDAPYPPDRFDRVVAKAGRQRHQRATQALGSLSVALAVLGSGIALDRSATHTVPADVLITALSRAEDVGTVRMEGKTTVSTPGTSVTMSFSGSVDFIGGTADMTLLSEFDGKKSEPQHFRLVGGFQYVSISPEMTGAYEAGKRWVRSPADASDSASEATDPRAAMEILRKAATSIEEVGRETVRGVRTTRYRFETLPSTHNPETFFGSDGGTVEAWIDDDGLPRRVRTTMDIPAAAMSAGSPGNPEAAESEGSSGTSTFEFYDYGVEVDINAPPAGETVDSDDPLLKAPNRVQQCMSERMAAVEEEVRAKYGSGDDVTKEEMQKVLEQLTEACEAQK